jgi:uncharacterized membrane protein YhdT
MNTKKLYSDVVEVGGYKWYCAYTFSKSIVHLSISVDMIYGVKLWFRLTNIASSIDFVVVVIISYNVHFIFSDPF